MKGKVYKFFWADVDTEKEYGEDVTIPPNTDAEKYIKGLLKDFNAEEDFRVTENPDYTSMHRKFVSIHETKAEKEILVKCYSTKYNLMTITRGNESYDLMQCENCKFMRKRPTLDWKENYCFPDKVCVECNKIFMSARNLILHNKRNSHRLPDWFPDGV